MSAAPAGSDGSWIGTQTPLSQHLWSRAACLVPALPNGRQLLLQQLVLSNAPAGHSLARQHGFVGRAGLGVRFSSDGLSSEAV